MHIRKQKGQFYSHFLLSFLKKNRLLLVCHTNNMSFLELMELKKKLKQFNLSLKFLKKKPLLQTCDSFDLFWEGKPILTGTIILIFSKKESDFSIDIFPYLQKNTTISVLSCYWKQFYSSFIFMEKLNKITSNSTNNKNLYNLHTELTYFDFLKMIIVFFNSLNKIKFYKVNLIKKLLTY